MFRRERERENRNLNGGPPVGQVRVLVVGDSGVGKTSLVHLIMKGSAIPHATQTVGCNVSVKHVTYPSGSSSGGIKDDSDRGFFVELWDVCGHERYKNDRSLFYSQINGIIFVHDLSQKRTKTSLHKWAAEIASTGTFSAPLAAPGPGGLSVPFIVIGNKADIASEITRGSSGNLVDLARHWVEKQGLLAPSEELPLTESFSGGGLIAAAKEARYDKEAVIKFFRLLIKRRYFSDELQLAGASSWLSHSNATQLTPSEIVSEDDQPFRNTSLSSDQFKYNTLPPLPAQRNLTPPPTLYPQQPISTIPNSYSIPRFSFTGSTDSTSVRSKRTDLNV